MKKYYKKNYKGRKGRKVATVQKVRKIVKSIVAHNTELKYFDTAAANSVDYAGSFYDLTALAQGDTDVTRDGDKLTLRKLKAKLSISLGDTTNLFRIVYFRWKQNNISVTPTQSYFSNPYTNNINCTYAPQNWDTHDNFQILYDRTFTLNTYTHPQRLITVNLKLSKLPKVAYDAGSTSGNNHIYLYLVSDSAAAVHPTVNMINRISFVDS